MSSGKAHQAGVEDVPADAVPLLTCNGQSGSRSDDGILDSVLHRKNFLTQACVVRVLSTLVLEAAALVAEQIRSGATIPDVGPENIVVLVLGAWDSRAAELLPEREYEDATAESPAQRRTEPARRVAEAERYLRAVSARTAPGDAPTVELSHARAALAAALDFARRMDVVGAARLRPSTLRCSSGRDGTGPTIITRRDYRRSTARHAAVGTIAPERRRGAPASEASIVHDLGGVVHAVAFVGARDRRTHVPPPSSPVLALIDAMRSPDPAARPTLADVAGHPILAVAHGLLGLPSQDAYVAAVARLTAGSADPSDRWWRRVRNPPRPGQPVPIGKLGGRHRPALPEAPPSPAAEMRAAIEASSADAASSASAAIAVPTSVAPYVAWRFRGGGGAPLAPASRGLGRRRSARRPVPRGLGALATDELPFEAVSRAVVAADALDTFVPSTSSSSSSSALHMKECPAVPQRATPADAMPRSGRILQATDANDDDDDDDDDDEIELADLGLAPSGDAPPPSAAGGVATGPSAPARLQLAGLTDAASDAAAAATASGLASSSSDPTVPMDPSFAVAASPQPAGPASGELGGLPSSAALQMPPTRAPKRDRSNGGFSVGRDAGHGPSPPPAVPMSLAAATVGEVSFAPFFLRMHSADGDVDVESLAGDDDTLYKPQAQRQSSINSEW